MTKPPDLQDLTILQAATPATLVHRIEAGDRAAEAELVARYRRGVAVILRKQLNAQDVEDLTQEVFLLVIEKVRGGEIREPDKLSGFVCSMARNLALGHFRRTPPVEHAEAPEAEDQSPGPLQDLLRQEDERAIKRVLAELPAARDRELLVRFYLKEDYKDRICHDLGITSLHFNRVLHRARERFRELYRLRESGPGPG